MTSQRSNIRLTKVEEESLARWRRGMLAVWLVVATVTVATAMFTAGA